MNDIVIDKQRLDAIEEKALNFIRAVAKSYSGDTLYAGNSGGKDSAVLDYLLKKSGIEYKSYYANTTIDPSGTIRYIRENYPHTEILQPKIPFYKLVEKKGLPTRLNRYCCERLKEYASVGRVVFEGVRSAESRKRQGRDYIQCDNRKWQKGAQHIYPLYDWTDDDIWGFISYKDIKIAPAYYNGMSRLGCVGCPLVSRKGHREKEFSIYPKHYERIKAAIGRGMANNPQWKLTQLSNGCSDIAMAWWLSGKTMNEYFQTNKNK